MKFQKGNKFAVGNSGRFKPGHKRNFLVDYSKRILPPQSEETKEKRRQTMIKKYGGWLSPFKGKSLSEESREKLRLMCKISGKQRLDEKHWNWKGGISNENTRLRNRAGLYVWRKAVKERDGYACVLCGITEDKAKLCTDHIKPFLEFPELRQDVNNGRTLCYPCHKKTETYGPRKRKKPSSTA